MKNKIKFCSIKAGGKGKSVHKWQKRNTIVVELPIEQYVTGIVRLKLMALHKAIRQGLGRVKRFPKGQGKVKRFIKDIKDI